MRPLPRWIRFRRARLLGAAVYVHWSVLVVIGVLALVSIKTPIHAAVAIASYLSVIVLHEFGHTLVARRRGYFVSAVRIGFLHGNCDIEVPTSQVDAVWIAWGGVLAQLAVAIPVLTIGVMTEDVDLGYLSPTIAFLGYFNLLIALFNLAPAPGMDGSVAWRVFSLIKRRVRARRKTNDVVTTLKRRR